MEWMADWVNIYGVDGCLGECLQNRTEQNRNFIRRKLYSF